jgi:hypothetical protein
MLTVGPLSMLVAEPKTRVGSLPILEPLQKADGMHQAVSRYAILMKTAHSKSLLERVQDIGM